MLSSQFCCAKLKIRVNALTPFQTLGQTLAFYNFKNPARQRFINLLEVEHSGTPVPEEDFSGRSKRDLWASIAVAIGRVLNSYPFDAKMAWCYRNLGDKSRQLSVEDIAKELGLRRGIVFRHLRAIDDALRAELQRRELLPK